MKNMLKIRILLCFAAVLVSSHQENDGNEQKNYELKKSVKVKLGFDRARINRYHEYNKWNQFKQDFNKEYESEEEESKRFEIFYRNHNYVKKHNREYQDGLHTFSIGLNEFSDMSPQEFTSTMNGFKRNYGDSLAKNYGSTFLEPHNVTYPQQIDWRQHGYVTPVKNQGHCGSCWAFSTTGSLEGQHKRKSGKLISLSEQNLVDCSRRFGNNGCEGGLMDQAFQYIKANDGIDTEAGYPYEAKDDTCRFETTEVGAEDTGFMDIKRGSEKRLKAAVATVGPVSVAIDASHPSFQAYSGGVYIEPRCSPEALDHGVLVVGYGTDEETGDDYWIVKNSWGPTWGEDGYVRMARNRNNMCGIASQASYPLV